MAEVILGAPGRLGARKAAEICESGEVPIALMARIAIL